VRALGRFLPLEPVAVPVRLRPPWRWSAPRRLPFGPAAHPSLLATAGPRPQVIVSCGRRSALAARWIQDHFEGRPKTVQILDCGLPPERFTWVIAPRHDELRGANVITTIGSLNPVDEEWLGRCGAEAGGGSAPAAPNRLLLPGGPSRNFDFSRRWFRETLGGLAGCLSGGSLTIVLSPRTPSWALEEIRRLPANGSVHCVAWNGRDPQGSERDYARALARADVILVTADSVNLASEACASGKPVCLVGLERARGKIARFGRYLVDEGFAHAFDPERMKTGLIGATRCLRETGRVARRLIDSGLL
jgi:mitochondrial fission protein ELM1